MHSTNIVINRRKIKCDTCGRVRPKAFPENESNGRFSCILPDGRVVDSSTFQPYRDDETGCYVYPTVPTAEVKAGRTVWHCEEHES